MVTDWSAIQSIDPLDKVMLYILELSREPLCAWKIVARLEVQVGERAIQKRLKRLEERGHVQRPNGQRKGYQLVA